MANESSANEDTGTSESENDYGKSRRKVPAIWTSTDVTPQQQQVWTEYWEQLDDKQPIFGLEATDYVDRFLEFFADDVGSARVLDFGCGFGLLSEAMSSHVGELVVWDNSDMRRIVFARLSGFDNVGYADLSMKDLDRAAGEFDFILVNSVIQYMTFDDLCGWLRRWKGLLGPGGRLVISDIMTHNYSFVRDLSAFLKICFRNGVLMRSVLAGIKEIGNYSSVKASRPLLKLDAQKIEEAAASADLDVEILPKNLTYHYGRLSAVFERKASLGSE